MRLLVLATLLLSAVGSAACLRYLDVTGCDGEASWTEPGIAEWVAAHGFRHGFGPPLNVSGPLNERVPPGTMLTYAFRQARVGSALVTIGTSGAAGDLQVSRDGGVERPSWESVLSFWSATMDRVYLGDEASRRAALNELRENEWLAKEPESSIPYRIQNAWTFQDVVRDNASFAPVQDAPFQELVDGEWHLIAAPPQWRRTWDVVGRPHLSSVAVDPNDWTRITFWYVDQEQEAKGLLVRAVPDFAWSFAGFRFETSCPRHY